MNRYRFTLTHDNGRVRITTTASSLAAAEGIVLRAEHAPTCAIVKRETHDGARWSVAR